MADPWDIPPIPTHGDENADHTYAAVGRALTQWEEIELSLSFLYGVFIGRPNDPKAFREYGLGNIFDARLTGLKIAAAGFFTGRPSQELEWEFDTLADLAQKCSGRRNEIAHGTVRPIQWTQLKPQEDTRFEFCLIPPHYTKKKFDANDMPIYAYASAQLLDFSTLFFEVQNRATRLRERILGALTPSPPKPAVPSNARYKGRPQTPPQES